MAEILFPDQSSIRSADPLAFGPEFSVKQTEGSESWKPSLMQLAGLFLVATALAAGPSGSGYTPEAEVRGGDPDSVRNAEVSSAATYCRPETPGGSRACHDTPSTF